MGLGWLSAGAGSVSNGGVGAFATSGYSQNPTLNSESRHQWEDECPESLEHGESPYEGLRHYVAFLAVQKLGLPDDGGIVQKHERTVPAGVWWLNLSAQSQSTRIMRWSMGIMEE